MKHVLPEEIPESNDLFSAEGLREHLAALGEPPLSLLIVGDIMLGGRSRRFIREYGSGYTFEALLPILQHSHIVVGNLEGPLTRKATKPSTRNYAYRVNPEVANSLKQARISVVTLANNHILDCGREGVLDTLEALARAGVDALGAGVDDKAAHTPVIREAARKRIGLLSYYWNPRCAATERLPGSARDSPEKLEADIRGLREQADRILVMFHWGNPYQLKPLPEDRAKARFAVDCGADAVVGHHPHVIQPFEVYRGRPIFFSIGNFAFGSGNSRAEGLMIGLRFEDEKTSACVYPLYVKNRDPRVAYQPKVLKGDGAEQKLRHLASSSGASGELLRIERGVGRLDLPRTGHG